MEKKIYKKKQLTQYTAGTFPALYFLRIRPFQVTSKLVIKPVNSIEVLDISSAVIRSQKPNKTIYNFKEVFIVEENNYTVFKRSISKLLRQAFSGYNFTVLLEGPKDSGKTFSLIGNGPDPGMLIVFMLQLMQDKYTGHHRSTRVFISFLQYFDHQIFDLLVCTRRPLICHQKGSSQHFYQLSQFQIFQFLQFLRLLKIALFFNQARDISVNHMQKPPRTNHFIVKITILKENGSSVNKSQVLFIDHQIQGREDEASRALLTLLTQLSEISARKQGLVDFEQSVYTKFLRKYIQNGTIIKFICLTQTQDPKVIENQLQTNKKLAKLNTKAESNFWTDPSLKTAVLQSELSLSISVLCQYCQDSKYQRFSDLRCQKQLLLQGTQSVFRKYKQLCRIVTNSVQRKISSYKWQSFFINLVKEKVGKIIKSSNIKDFYNSKTYSSLQLEIRNAIQKCIQRINHFHSIAPKLLEDFRKVKVQSRNFIKTLNSCELGPKLKSQIRGLLDTIFGIMQKKLVMYSCQQLQLNLVQLIQIKIKDLDLFEKIQKKFNDLLSVIRRMDLDILNCYQQSYLNHSNSILQKVNQARLRSVANIDLPNDQSRKFKKIKQLPKMSLPKNVVYLNSYLQQRLEKRSQIRKILSQPEPPSEIRMDHQFFHEESKMSMQLGVIKEEMPKLVRRKPTQKNTFTFLNYRTASMEQASVTFLSKIP